MNLSRNRLILLATLALMIGFHYSTTGTRSRSQAGDPAKVTSGRASLPSPLRHRNGAGNASGDRPQQALTKMRSLIEMRQGEVAFIRLSSSMMRLLLEDQDSVARETAESFGKGSGLAGFLEREWMERKLEELVARESSIEGIADLTDESFKWSSSNWEIRGRTDHIGDSARFTLYAGDEKTGTEMIFRAPHGSNALIRMPGAEPEGVLMVIGKDGATGVEEGNPP